VRNRGPCWSGVGGIRRLEVSPQEPLALGRRKGQLLDDIAIGRRPSESFLVPWLGGIRVDLGAATITLRHLVNKVDDYVSRCRQSCTPRYPSTGQHCIGARVREKGERKREKWIVDRPVGTHQHGRLRPQSDVSIRWAS
jgi:hypothetical protein